MTEGAEPPAPPDRHPLRALYAIEFLLALAAIFLGWPQIGGQSHLDIMDWRWKLGLGGGLALAIAAATRAAVIGKTWTAIAWTVLALLLVAGMGAVTYFYHLQDEPEQPENLPAERAAGRRGGAMLSTCVAPPSCWRRNREVVMTMDIAPIPASRRTFFARSRSWSRS